MSYQRLAWSPTGQLAYAAVTRTRDNAASTLYVKDSLTDPPKIVEQSDEHFVIYIYWSPVACADQPGCHRLAYLIEEAEDIGLHFVQITDQAISNQIIGFGWPYYFSWSADGQSIVWHTGGGYQENPAAELALYDLAEAKTHRFPHQPAGFLAPAWSPRDNIWIGATISKGDAMLRQFSPESTTALAEVSSGGTAFVWSPNGQQIAYAMRPGNNVRYYGPIHLFDQSTGQIVQLTDNDLRVLAFFWDPAGQRLAYLTVLSMPGEEWMQWRVYDVVRGKDKGYKTFNPSLQMKFVMASFNQYAQSHRFWSPDGRYLVYANRDILQAERIWLIDTWNEDGNNAILVDEGTMGFWSWQ